MKENITKILKLDDRDFDLFQNSINALITGNFLIRGVDEQKKYYNFVVANSDIVEAYLECAGWMLKIDEPLGVISWMGSASTRQNMLLDETLVLLVFRLIYEEKRHEISLHHHPSVIQQDFQDKFRSLCERQLKKTRFREIIRRFQVLKLIQIHGDETDPDSQIELYPSIVYAFDGKSIDDVYSHIQSLEGDENAVDDADLNTDMEEKIQ